MPIARKAPWPPRLGEQQEEEQRAQELAHVDRRREQPDRAAACLGGGAVEQDVEHVGLHQPAADPQQDAAERRQRQHVREAEDGDARSDQRQVQREHPARPEPHLQAAVEQRSYRVGQRPRGDHPGDRGRRHVMVRCQQQRHLCLVEDGDRRDRQHHAVDRPEDEHRHVRRAGRGGALAVAGGGFDREQDDAQHHQRDHAVEREGHAPAGDFGDPRRHHHRQHGKARRHRRLEAQRPRPAAADQAVAEQGDAGGEDRRGTEAQAEARGKQCGGVFEEQPRRAEQSVERQRRQQHPADAGAFDQPAGDGAADDDTEARRGHDELRDQRGGGVVAEMGFDSHHARRQRGRHQPGEAAARDHHEHGQHPADARNGACAQGDVIAQAGTLADHSLPLPFRITLLSDIVPISDHSKVNVNGRPVNRSVGWRGAPGLRFKDRGNPYLPTACALDNNAEKPNGSQLDGGRPRIGVGAGRNEPSSHGFLPNKRLSG
jgi:hypothetical protein